jgi:hypothetical protein
MKQRLSLLSPLLVFPMAIPAVIAAPLVTGIMNNYSYVRPGFESVY